MAYQKMIDEDVLEVNSGDLVQIQCCDCGLVHNVRVECDLSIKLSDSECDDVEHPVIRMQWVRNNQATGQCRRHLHGNLQTGNGVGGYMMIKKEQLKRLLKVEKESKSKS